MKKFNFTISVIVAVVMACSFAACTENEDPGLEPEQPSVVEEDYHFDLFLTVGKHGGMSSKNTTIVNSTDKLSADKGIISIKGEGTELGDYAMECISKGKYYYQIPSSNDRFVKYQIKNNQVQVVAERPFKSNTYKVRSYAHAWTDDQTLVIMSANGEKTQIIWTKLNTTDMSIVAEGTLPISVPQDWEFLTTSGILTYRQSDNRLFYFYYAKRDKDTSNPMRATNESRFRTAVIDASTMEVIQKDIVAPVDSEMAGSAYGQLMQDCVMYDEDDNLYLACFTDEDEIEKGMLLRIKSGAYTFDSSYNGYKDADGKLLTVQYLGNNKALAYGRNDASGTNIDSYSHYYSIIDLSTGSRSRLSYGGKEIAYSGGRFSQRSVIFNGKAFIGVNTEADENSIIYVYDISTGTVEKGAEVGGEYFFDMIRVLENDL